MGMEDVIGHAAQIAQLRGDLESGNLAHAYLFVGPPHVGKFSVAKAFAAEILLRDVAPAGRERAAHQIERLIHPDLLVLDQLWIEDVQEDWDAIAKTSNVPQEHRADSSRSMKTDTIGIDDVRAVQDRLYATGGPHRCCLVRSVERMQDEAANALLKILEEPPPGRVFVLTAAAASLLLPTVVSRCRVLHFHPLAHRDLAPLLEDFPEEDRGFLLHLAQGSPGVLRTMRDDPDRRREERLMHTAALGFWTATSLVDRLKTLTPLHKRGPEAERFLLHLSLALRDCHPQMRAAWGSAPLELARLLQPNANRALLCTRFALQVAAVSLSPVSSLQ